MIFLEYLKISFWMTPVILFVFWVLPKVSQRYTAKLAYFIWLLIAVRLVLPWNLTLPSETVPIQLDIPQESIMKWIPDEEQTKEMIYTNEREEKSVIIPLGTEQKKEKLNFAVMPAQFLCGIWILGVSVSLLYTVISTDRLKKLLKRWEREPSELTKKIYAETAEGNKPYLKISSVLDTPMTVGLFDTKVYLPHEAYTEQKMAMIFRHELIHWQRKDLWYKFLLLFARSIHWFNPCVWMMEKRANRDLEISCDGEVVQKEDMTYRKAYSLMILQEAEEGLQKQEALTTCFVDGKRVLQERLAEVMNGRKRKKGILLAGIILVLAFTSGCLVSCSGDAQASKKSVAVLSADIYKMAEKWAEALENRNGKVRYEMMNEECKNTFVEEQNAGEGEDWNYSIGWSSPWVISYEIEVKEETAIITYTMQDSIPQVYTMKELLRFGEENGKPVVRDYYESNIYWEDGKVYPVRSKKGVELDEGIWDFMYQSVIGFISQSKWSVYELENFAFDIQKVEKERLPNGMDEVRVDFILKVTHRNPFCNPDEVEYIKQAKENDSKYYEELYEGYYGQQDVVTTMQFVCQVSPDASYIYEDTCNPDSFCIYTSDEVHPMTAYYNNETFAYLPYYSETPEDGWFCTLRLSIDDSHALIQRQIIISDVSGRTNNGYFRLNIGMPEQYRIAEDAVITVGGAGEALRTMEKEEWVIWRRATERPIGYTLNFKQDEKGEYRITELKEGW